MWAKRRKRPCSPALVLVYQSSWTYHDFKVLGFGGDSKATKEQEPQCLHWVHWHTSSSHSVHDQERKVTACNVRSALYQAMFSSKTHPYSPELNSSTVCMKVASYLKWGQHLENKYCHSKHLITFMDAQNMGDKLDREKSSCRASQNDKPSTIKHVQFTFSANQPSPAAPNNELNKPDLKPCPKFKEPHMSFARHGCQKNIKKFLPSAHMVLSKSKYGAEHKWLIGPIGEWSIVKMANGQMV
ncbi:hypothetical protein EDC04DRAFT_2600284 [Pisolithus marmoratus]|nr:hypothetical protein EDC04DRAFT_2600284 [Pisolithus marmoratus]